MPFDAKPSGDPGGAYCKGCRQPIRPGEPTARIVFGNDPLGALGLTGAYHVPCGRAFASLSRVIDMMRWSRS
jgi:hypothetical protein